MCLFFLKFIAFLQKISYNIISMKFCKKGMNFQMEKNKITITINNRDYTLVSADTKEHMEMVAEYIDKKIGEITFASGGSLTIQDTSILAAINVADDYFKSEETADNLRSQIKQYIDEASAASFKNSQLETEVARLKAEIRALKER